MEAVVSAKHSSACHIARCVHNHCWYVTLWESRAVSEYRIQMAAAEHVLFGRPGFSCWVSRYCWIAGVVKLLVG
jgi:hypothetical protein